MAESHMSAVSITIATGRYDRTSAIQDGRVPVEGCDVTYLNLEPEELFFRAFRYAEFDVAELSFSSYMMQHQRGVGSYLAIPVFPSRMFRHSGFYIRTDRGIETLIRYSIEQGLIPQPVDVDSLFAPSTLTVSKI